MKTKRLSLKIPPGVETGSRLRLPGEGEPSDGGGPPGDLYVFIQVAEHETFRRHGDHVVIEQPLPYTLAAIGGELEIPTLEGTEVLTIPRGTQTGHEFRLAGKGIPHLRGRGRGDLIVLVYIDVPKKLTSEQEDLLRQLALLEGTNVTPKKRKLFSRSK
jgi:molecular chaperone DnaJ